MRPSEILEKNRQAIRDTRKRFNAATPRFLGSGGLQDILEALLKVRVDLVTSGGIRKSMRDRILSEAAPI